MPQQHAAATTAAAAAAAAALLVVSTLGVAAAAAEEERPQLPAPRAPNELGKWLTEVLMLTMVLGALRVLMYLRWAQRNAWFWRKQEKKITGWDDFREAPKYDMVLPPESTVFDGHFFDEQTGKSTGKSYSAVRLALILRARAILPMMHKVNQDHPEMSRLHAMGLLDTESFDAVDAAMQMMKDEIKDLEDIARRVGFIPTKESGGKGPNVWAMAKLLIDLRRQMEAEKNIKIAEHEEQERATQAKAKAQRKLQAKANKAAATAAPGGGNGKATKGKKEMSAAEAEEEKRRKKIADELLAEEDKEKKKAAKKKGAKNKKKGGKK